MNSLQPTNAREVCENLLLEGRSAITSSITSCPAKTLLRIGFWDVESSCAMPTKNCTTNFMRIRQHSRSFLDWC